MAEAEGRRDLRADLGCIVNEVEWVSCEQIPLAKESGTNRVSRPP
jgi:hypothetical protein